VTAAILASVWPGLCGWLICCAFFSYSPGSRDSLLLPGALFGWVLVSVGTPWLDHNAIGWGLLILAAIGSTWQWVRPSDRFDLALWKFTQLGALSRVAWWCCLLLIVAGLYLAASETLQRPLYPWDAWSAWAVKSKIWFSLGRDVEFIATEQWLAGGSAGQFAVNAAHYPELLPHTQLWVANWVGSWHDSLINLPLLSVVSACLLSTYATLRRTAGPLAAMAACYMIATLPLLVCHLAIAGYADLWMACALWIAALGVTQQPADGQRGSFWRWVFVLCLALVAAMMLKLEGLVWTAMFCLALAYASVGQRFRRAFLAVGLNAFWIWLVVGGFSFESPWGPIAVEPGLINLPYLGQHELAFSNQAWAFASGMFIEPNWHLLWYLIVLIGLPSLWLNRHSRLAEITTAVLLASLCFLFGLFFFTEAAAWAKSMTASNRLVLQIVPMLAILLTLNLFELRSQPSNLR